jgi:hypothetical protein
MWPLDYRPLLSGAEINICVAGYLHLPMHFMAWFLLRTETFRSNIHIHIYSSLHKSVMGFNPPNVEFVIHMYSTFT